MARASTAAVRLTTGEREPARLGTTANLTTVIVDGVEKIVGLQTVDGQATVAGDRVVVKDQTNATLNGIYTASAGYWFRAADSRTSRAMQKGTTVHVQQGSTNAGKVFVFQTYEPNIGTDNIVLSLYLSAGLVSTDGTMAANSDELVPSQKAAKTYIDAAITALRAGVAAAGDTLAELYTLITNHTSNTSNPHSVTAAQVGLGTGDSPQFANVNLGHASDTTLSRSAAGVMAVEGNAVPSPASQATNDILVRGASSWMRLAIGSALQVLRVNAAGNGLEYAAATGLTAYDSGQQTITSAGSLTLAHGLGSKPKLILAALQCTTAELGYSIGDELCINPNAQVGTNDRGATIVPDATNLNIRFGGSANAFNILRKDTGVLNNITNSSWRFVVRAWV